MANRGYNYQYETSPRKLEPDYRRPQPKKPIQNKPNQGNKKQSKKSVKGKTKKKLKLSFEIKFFVNSMLFFAMIFAIIACQALVNQRYKEKESLKQKYDELLSSSNMAGDLDNNVRVVASEYGMQTKSATLIDLGTSDYIEASTQEDTEENTGFFSKVINWIKENF